MRYAVRRVFAGSGELSTPRIDLAGSLGTGEPCRYIDVT
jgi:hypothetical protein